MSDIEKNTSAAMLIRAAIAIGKAGKKLDERIHQNAVGCLKHAEVYGDCTPIQTLYKVLSKGQRREALLDWVHANSPIRIRQEGDKVGMLKEADKGFTPFDIAAADAVPYYEKNERAMKPIGEADILKVLQSKIELFEKRMAEAALPENSNVVYFKEGVDPAAEIATMKRQLAALQSLAA